MKLWIISSTLSFLVFVVFFARKFPSQNLWFASVLGFNVAVQVVFSIYLALGRTKDIPDWPIAVTAWGLILAALVKAWLTRGAVNEIIFQGLAAHVALNLLLAAVIWFYGRDFAVRVIVSNLAALAPFGYMLVRFTFVESDWLRIAAGSPVSGAREILGWARVMLG